MDCSIPQRTIGWAPIVLRYPKDGKGPVGTVVGLGTEVDIGLDPVQGGKYRVVCPRWLIPAVPIVGHRAYGNHAVDI